MESDIKRAGTVSVGDRVKCKLKTIGWSTPNRSEKEKRRKRRRRVYNINIRVYYILFVVAHV